MEDFLRLRRLLAAAAARFVLMLSSRSARWRRAWRLLAGLLSLAHSGAKSSLGKLQNCRVYYRKNL